MPSCPVHVSLIACIIAFLNEINGDGDGDIVGIHLCGVLEHSDSLFESIRITNRL